MIKDIFNKIRKGVKAGMYAIKNNDDIDRIIKGYIEEFNNSTTRDWMLKGHQYYDVENDIKNNKHYRMTAAGLVEDLTKANNKLAHATYKNLVDEKINYLLSKEVTLKCDDKKYVDLVKDLLGKKFQYQLSELGYESSNKGIGWLQVYIDEEGKFNTIVIPSEQCIPLWANAEHRELSGMIRYYITTEWQGNNKKDITNIEYWTKEGVEFFRLDGNSLVPDYEKNIEGEVKVAHFKETVAEETIWRGWGKVPFIPFKNNRIERPDIKFVKSLIDNYDKSRSEAANYVEDVKNLIYVIKGYGGANLKQFMEDLNYYRAISIDDVEDGGVDVLTPTMDLSSYVAHYDKLKEDIIEGGQGVNKNIDKMGSAPSGIALKFLYSGLDLKCNAIESEFKIAFENLLWFVDEYLKTSNSNYESIDLDIIFNRDIKINEAEAISNCGNSQGLISKKTILANHPWIDDIEEEEKSLKEETDEFNNAFDKVPIKVGGAVGE